MIDEHPASLEPERSAEPLAAVLFERRRQVDYGSRWHLLLIVYFLGSMLLDSLEYLRRGDRVRMMFGAVALAIFTVLGVVILIYFLWRRYRGPEAQPLQLRVTDQGITGPQPRDNAPESVCFGHLSGVAWEQPTQICFETKSGPPYVVSMETSTKGPLEEDEADHMTVRRILSERLPFYESKFPTTPTPRSLSILKRHEDLLFWVALAFVIAWFALRLSWI